MKPMIVPFLLELHDPSMRVYYEVMLLNSVARWLNSCSILSIDGEVLSCVLC